MPALNKRDLIAFLDRNVERGWMNMNTGRSWKAACNKILEDVGDEDDLQRFDVRSAVLRFHNRHPGDLSSESLRIYERRVKQALESFASWLVDPTTYKPVARGLAADTPKKTKKEGAALSTPKDDSSAPPPPPAPPPERRAHVGQVTDTSLAMPFPMRPNFLAQIVVPRDMTNDEAKRLCQFVMALATWNPETPV